MKKIIKSRWNCKCAETGKTIAKHEYMLYDYQTKKCYHNGSQAFSEFNSEDPAAGMVQANEDAYFDKFCQINNI